MSWIPRTPLLLLVAGNLFSLPLVFEQRGPARFTARVAGGTLEFGTGGFRLVGSHRMERTAFGGVPHADGAEGQANYFHAAGHSSIPQFQRLTYRDLYPGIDLVFYGDGQKLEYDFRIAPGAAPSEIALHFPDAASLTRSADGDLLAGAFHHMRPVAYQVIDGVRRSVAAEFTIEGRTVGFAVGAYDLSRPLVIDPVLLYTDSVGGSGSDVVQASAMDSQGNLYLLGQTGSVDFPVVGGLKGASPGVALLESTDGKTVIPVHAGAVGDVEAMAVSADGGAIYLSATTATLRSIDGGTTWMALSPGLPAVANALAVDAGSAQTIYAATAVGLFKSTDGGQNWVERDTGFPLNTNTPSVGILAAHPSRAGYLMAGTASPRATFRSFDGGETWSQLTLATVKGQGIGSTAQSIAFGAGQTVFATTTASQLMQSDDDGATWETIALQGTQFPQSLAVDPVNPSTLYLANSSGFLRSTDSGATFQLLGLANTPDLQGALVVAGNPERFYTRDDTHVYTSGDGGLTWTTLLSGDVLRCLLAVPGKLLIGSVVQRNLFISKWDPVNRHFIYSSYLGGSGQDTSVGIAVDTQDSVYLTATTTSIDIPLTANAAESTPALQSSGYLAKISADGSQLLYASYFNEGQPSAIAVDGQGSLYVTGTALASLRATAGAAQTSAPASCTRSTNSVYAFQTGAKVFVEKWKPDFSGLAYATFLDGSCGDYAYGLTVDPAGSAWIAGSTYSPDFPTTSTAVQPVFAATDNLQSSSYITSGFAAALSPAGDKISYGTFLGQTVTSQANGIAPDGLGNIYVTGSTWGFPFPTSPGAWQSQIRVSCEVALPIVGPSAPSGGSDSFIIRLNLANASDYKLTYLGGSCDDAGQTIAADSLGHVWVAGSTNSADFPTRIPYYGMGTQPGFVAELSADLTSLLFSSFTPQSTVTVDGSGNAEVAGTFYGPPKMANSQSPQSGEVEISRIGGDNPPLQIDAVLKFKAPTLQSAFYTQSTIAPGEMVRIVGQNLGPAIPIPAQLTASGTVATQLNGIQVLFDGVPAPLISMQAEEILCMTPFALNGRATTQVTVSNGGQKSNEVTLGVSAKSTDILTLLNQDFTVNSAANPAPLGSIVSLYIAGEGQTVPAGMDGAVNALPLAVPVSPFGSVRIYDPNGPSEATLAIPFQAAAYGLVAGISQVNVQLPAVYAGANPSILVLDDSATISIYFK